MKNKIYLISALTILSCSPYPKKVSETLEMAGENRPELEKVLEHYKTIRRDDEKLDAAYFLLINMVDKYHIERTNIHEFDYLFDSLSQIRTITKGLAGYNKMKKEVDEQVLNFISHLDSLQKTMERGNSKTIFDLHEIKGEYLINNIDLAFKTRREYPWCKKISKENFYEFVLPYKVSSEKPEYWRKELMERYKWVFDSIKDPTNPIEVCNLINEDLKTWFRFDVKMRRYPITQPYSLLIKGKTGTCEDMTNITLLAMRSMGLPISKESILRQGDIGVSHAFNSFVDDDTIAKPFMGTEKSINEFKMHRSIPKIYRNQYSINYQSELYDALSSSEVPNIFYKYSISDVSNKYININNEAKRIHFYPFSVQIPILLEYKKMTDFIYLCTSDKENWGAACLGKQQKGLANFNLVGSDIVFLPAIYRTNDFIPVNFPIIVSGNNKFRVLKPNFDSTTNMTLYRKYAKSFAMKNYARQLIGTHVYIKNNHKTHCVDSIISEPEHYSFEGKKLTSNNTGTVIYLQFPDQPNIAELRVYFKAPSDSTEKLFCLNDQCNNIASAQIYTNSNFDQAKNAFDNDIRTNYMGSAKDYLGIKTQRPIEFTRYEVLVRNKFNIIEPGHEYELLYWDNEWISFNQIRATKNELNFNSVPTGCLYLLKNLTKGKEERIFTFENGKQVFW